MGFYVQIISPNIEYVKFRSSQLKEVKEVFNRINEIKQKRDQINQEFTLIPESKRELIQSIKLLLKLLNQELNSL